MLLCREFHQAVIQQRLQTFVPIKKVISFNTAYTSHLVTRQPSPICH
jgi:hypothetical protein